MKANNNRIIATFMGYPYYHKGILFDDSYCGGLYESFEVFSKVHIEVDDYGDGECYFKELPNPDYGKDTSDYKTSKIRRFRNDLKTVDWSNLNYENYIRSVRYENSWDELMPVVKKIMDFKGIDSYKETEGWYAYYGMSTLLELVDINDVYENCLKFINWYNTK